jgi:hypothetical protein
MALVDQKRQRRQAQASRVATTTSLDVAEEQDRLAVGG